MKMPAVLTTHRGSTFSLLTMKVPGDLVVLSLGGAVPADCRLLAGKEIGVDQVALLLLVLLVGPTTTTTSWPY